jgi:Mrp family chromosome partitioning ATPase/capsular polysaccharide biosynthesis protein
MNDLDATSRPATLAHYLSVLRRRKWVLLPPVLIVPIVAYLLTADQTPQYKASAQVLLGHQDLSGAITDIPDTSFTTDPTRLAANAAAVARSPVLAQRVVDAAGVKGISADGLLGESDVSPRADADVLDFTVQDQSPAAATRLATTYAKEYTSFRHDIDTKSLRDAMAKLDAKIADLRSRGVSQDSPLYTQLLDAQTKLETAQTLVTGNTTLLRPADGASQVAPRPKRNAILGGLAGLVLGLGLVFLYEALDNRVRSEQELEERLGVPVLGRLPRPPQRLQRAERLVMVEDPESPAAEAFRQLRTNLDFANMDVGARTILVTSAVEREGKSTTAANLGVALARAGRRVVLVDLDLRRPTLHRFFDVQSSPGVTDVVLGADSLDDALNRVLVAEHTQVVLDDPRESRRGARRTASAGSDYLTNGDGKPIGTLELLPVGAVPLDPGEFVVERGLGQMLLELRERADIVLIDTPPLLTVGDAMTLSARADALLGVFRLRETRRASLANLARQLEKSPATTLGFVVTDAVAEDGYGVAYSSAYYAGPRAGRRERDRSVT